MFWHLLEPKWLSCKIKALYSAYLVSSYCMNSFCPFSRPLESLERKREFGVIYCSHLKSGSSTPSEKGNFSPSWTIPSPSQLPFENYHSKVGGWLSKLTQQWQQSRRGSSLGQLTLSAGRKLGEPYRYVIPIKPTCVLSFGWGLWSWPGVRLTYRKVG